MRESFFFKFFLWMLEPSGVRKKEPAPSPARGNDSQQSLPSLGSVSSNEVSPTKVPPVTDEVLQPLAPCLLLPALGEQEDAIVASSRADHEDARRAQVAALTKSALWSKTLRHPDGCAKCTEPFEGKGHPLPGCGHPVLCKPCHDLLSQLGLGNSSLTRLCKLCPPP